MTIKSLDHIELTVSNLEESRKFYEKLPGFKLVANYPNFLMFVCGNFHLGLTDHKRKLDQKVFSETNVGLDHVAFAVKSKQDLYEALEFLRENKIVHGEIKKLSNGQLVLAFRDPDNIQLEFSLKE